MIICRDQGFVFIHIPKNAGSSIRNQIEHLDSYEGAFGRNKLHEAIGRYDAAHMPLDLVRDLYPEVLDEIRSLTSYAITREPVERFVSALAQRARQYHKISPDRLDALTIDTDITDALSAAASTGVPDRKFIFFTPQWRYVDLDDQRVIDNLFTVDDLDALIKKLEVHIGSPLISEFHANRTVTFRHSGMERPLTRAKDFAKKVLPLGSYNRLRQAAMQVFTKSGVDHIEAAVRGSDKVLSAIRAVYARDFDLHAEAERVTGNRP